MKPVFVFGSNLAGRHGKGAALTAVRQYGARYGAGHGLHGNSYAIPTKDRALHALPLPEIAMYVREFIAFAGHHPDLAFNVTAVGCGLAGYDASQIAPLFAGAPGNCSLPDSFKEVLA